MSTAKIQLIVGAVFVLVIGTLSGYIGHLQRSNQALALRSYNDSAALDSTRRLADVLKGANRILGDSLEGVTRLVIQRTVERDQLDRALHQVPKVSVTLTLTMPSLRVSQVPSTLPVLTDDQGTRHASFHVEHAAYSANLGVSLPAAGAAVLDSLLVNPNPARLALRIGCQAANGDGIRPARVTVTSPTWMSISVTAAEQAPEVCQGVAGQGTSWLRRFLSSFAPELYLGVGLSADPFPILRGQPPTIAPALHAGVSLVHVPLKLPWPK